MAFPKIDGYVVTEKLGSGSYSTVYKAYTKVGARSVVAIKCVDKSRVKQSGAAVDNLVTEIRLLKTLSHPHIVHMKHFTWDDKNIYIITEYCCGGDLSKYIHKCGRVPEQRVLYFLQQLASALKYLREKGVVHMDLKPHNLLLHKGSDGKYILKVADFGFAAHLTEDTTRSIRGSPLYMAPEMLRGDSPGRYDARVDLWSVGVIMYECLFGRAPYSSSTLRELLDKIQRRAPIEIPSNSSISPGCRDLLSRLLRHDPDDRISYEEFFQHEYLDLDHMPSKDNYEKAVSLIKQAIELDCAGRLGEAFAAYRDSLRYLVPCSRAETDPVRKSALTGKLTRYMERAEEIKHYLRYPEGPPSPAPARAAQATPPLTPAPAPPATPALTCCTAARSDNINSYDFSNLRNPCSACVCNGSASGMKICSCTSASETQEVNGRVEQPATPSDDSTSQSSSERSADSRSGSVPARLVRRLFGRGAPPYLNKDDSSIAAESCGKGQKQTDVKQSDVTGDACRIT